MATISMNNAIGSPITICGESPGIGTRSSYEAGHERSRQLLGKNEHDNGARTLARVRVTRFHGVHPRQMESLCKADSTPARTAATPGGRS